MSDAMMAAVVLVTKVMMTDVRPMTKLHAGRQQQWQMAGRQVIRNLPSHVHTHQPSCPPSP